MTSQSPLTAVSRHKHWLVAALVVALVPFFTACPPDRADDPTVVDDRDMDDMPVTSVAQLTAADAQRLEGRDVELFNVEIVEVRGDTAFYVTDDRAIAPGTAPGTTPTEPAPNAQPGQQPGQQPGARPGVGTDDRVMVHYDRGLLGIDMGGDDDVIRVGQRVNVYGTVAVRNGAMRDRAAPRQDPAMQDDPAMRDDPAVQQPTPTTPGAGIGNVYVRADRVERADATAPPAAGAPGTGTPGQTAPGQTGPDAGDQGY